MAIAQRHYDREEEFLEAFYNAAAEAAKLLEGDWQPNPDCNDSARKNFHYFMNSGQLHALIFDSATVYHDFHGFHSVQIVLKSCDRVVNVEVKREDGKLIGKKIFDRPKT